MTDKLSSFFNNLKINKFYAKCTKVSASNNTVKFSVEFSKPPKIFVTVNKFTITYGADGTLEKNDIGWTPHKDKVSFDKEDLQGANIPVCILATEVA